MVVLLLILLLLLLHVEVFREFRVARGGEAMLLATLAALWRLQTTTTTRTQGVHIFPSIYLSIYL